MSQINPFTGSILQAPHVQRTQAVDKDRQLRRVHDRDKNSALQGDELQHEVESSEAISPANDEQPKNPRQRKSAAPPHEQADGPNDAGEAHLDLTA